MISTVATAAAAAAPNAPSILLAVGRLVDAPTSTVHHRKLYQHSFGEDDRRRARRSRSRTSAIRPSVQIMCRSAFSLTGHQAGTAQGVYTSRALISHTHTYTRARVCGDSC